jgi:cyclopentanol dehydrogenase
MGRLTGKIALISGASRGQGAAEARLFAAEGAAVVLTDVLDLAEVLPIIVDPFFDLHSVFLDRLRDVDIEHVLTHERQHAPQRIKRLSVH